MSDTPIFDAVTGVRGKNGYTYEELRKPFLAPLGPFPVASDQKFAPRPSLAIHSLSDVMANLTKDEVRMGAGFLTGISPVDWAAKTIGQTPQPENYNAVISATIHPEEAEEKFKGGMYEFVQLRMREFNDKHPNAIGVVVERSERFDGSVTITVKGFEVEGCQMAHKAFPGVLTQEDDDERPLTEEEIAKLETKVEAKLTSFIKKVDDNEERKNNASTDTHPRMMHLILDDEEEDYLDGE